MKQSSLARLLLRGLLIGATGLALAACTPAPRESGITDPWESSNRATHRFNKGLDSALIRPVGKTYVAVLPPPVVTGVSNFASNLATPSLIVNSALQGDAQSAAISTVRFVLNTTLGVGGLLDVATVYGLQERDTDFGQTLHSWGVPEGNYLELPVLGPSTERDTVGRIVDLFTNPLGYVLETPERYAGPVATAGKRLGERGRYSQTIDSVLYDSADSYAQARSTYLQTRRYRLGGSESSADPYELTDPYGAPAGGAAATGDPYDDPYLQ
ncbi:MlaA family lipoprotein [Pseudooceanicola sp. C21-150M6]|uniref:MlaA family lipoprotein n=1 Tax=Pseudooceanicola sp. C21-150M6 TaxID=3434355 RepID=UPI003D7F70E7